MEFNIPKKKYMNEICGSIKKLYKLDFYKFVSELGIRIFYITDSKESFIMIIDHEEHKIDIFNNEEGFLTCHFFLSGDQRGIRTFGVTNYTIEESVYSDDNPCGINHYLSIFKHYEADEDLYVTFHANKPGQMSIALEEDEVIELNRFINKIITVIKKLKNDKNLKRYSVDTVCVCDFTFNKNNFEVDYLPLDSFDFFPKIEIDSKNENMIASLENIDVKSGEIHIGMIYGFSPYDSYNNLTDFEVTLCPIVLYGLTMEGEMRHIIFSTPYKRKQEVSNVIFAKFFNEVGIYDTVITDSLFIYNSLCSTLSSIGVEVKLELNNPVNTFITKFIIKMIQQSDDVATLDEILIDCRNELKELFLSSVDDLEELNEQFFNESEQFVIEEDEEDEEESEEEEFTGFVS